MLSSNIDNFDRYDHFKKQMDLIQKFYNIRYLMEEVRITFKKNFSINIDGGLSFEAKEGEINSIPRWLAQILEENNSIEIQDMNILISISRSLNRERISKPHDLSGIDSDFYIRANDFIRKLKDKEKESILVSLNSFVASRIAKIVKLAAASPLSNDLEKKLSAEEKELYNFIYKSSSEFKQTAVKKP